jgi:hypothetical protein
MANGRYGQILFSILEVLLFSSFRQAPELPVDSRIPEFVARFILVLWFCFLLADYSVFTAILYAPVRQHPVAGIDHVIGMGVADPEKLAIMGWS